MLQPLSTRYFFKQHLIYKNLFHIRNLRESKAKKIHILCTLNKKRRETADDNNDHIY